ncbi:MAG: membrane-associated phospholipid phosphatase [Arenicella sp.]|jgi:membrane-associated phospholipid phosphatase
MNQILHDISWVVPLRNELVTPLFQVFTWLGYPTFIILALALGYWLWGKAKFTRVAIIVLTSTILNAFLKDLWENPRPDLVFRLDGKVGESFGMPSGHAQVSAVLWFWLAFQVRQTWAWIVATIMVIGICFSRLYLGIHDLEDIAAGLLIAMLSLFAFGFLLTPRFKRLRDSTVWLRLALVVVLAITVNLAWPPAEHSLGALTLFGLLFTWILGVSIETHLVAFEPRRTGFALALIVIIGVIGLIALLAITTSLLSRVEPLIAGTITSALLGIYITVLAPMLFKLCNLCA